MKVCKECSKCNQIKDLSEFYNDSKNKKHGKTRWCKICMKQKQQEWYDANKEKALKISKDWVKNNKEKSAQWRASYVREARKDKSWRFSKYMRKRLNEKLRTDSKYDHCFSPTTGCTNGFLKEYIESQFSKCMSWGNYGAIWNIDHIIPISAFDEKSEREYVNHYLNLQPAIIAFNSTKGKSFKLADKEKLINSILSLKTQG